MPLDDYASLGGGALRLKGAKVTKKKKRKDKSGLEKALSGGETSLVKAERDAGEGRSDEEKRKSRRGRDEKEEEEEEEERPVVRKTEAEKRIDELKRKRVGYPSCPPLGPVFCCGGGRGADRNSSLRWRRILRRGLSF